MTPDELKKIRADHGITQQQAARIAGVTLRSWQYWEAGTVAVPALRLRFFRDELRKYIKRADMKRLSKPGF
jgi:DNA-binding transcriptional regulator YiaG